MSNAKEMLELIDDLEDIVQGASKVPFSSGKIVIDAEDIGQIIDDMRQNLPQDLKQAQWIKEEKDRILGEAKEEYGRIIDAAKKQAEYLVENDAIRKEAEKRARTIMSEASNHSVHIRCRTYDYIDSMLYDIQTKAVNAIAECSKSLEESFKSEITAFNMKMNHNREEMVSLSQDLREGRDIEDESVNVSE